MTTQTLRELVELRQDAAAFAADSAQDALLRARGLPGASTVAARVKAHRLATSSDGLSQGLEALAGAEEKERAGEASQGRVARLQNLRDLLVRARAQGLEPGAAQELIERPARNAVRPPGDAGLHGALPPLAVERELPFERSREQRADLEGALAEAAARDREPASAAWEAAQAALAELKLGEPAEAAALLQARGWATLPEGEACAAQVQAACERFLWLTDPVAKDLFAWLLERHTHARVHPGNAGRHDALHLLFAPRCASAFPRGELVRTVRRFAEAWGLDLSAGGLVKLDEEERPLKPRGARALPVDPPHAALVVLLPEEGPRALAELLGAVSEAQRLVGPPGDAPPEDLWGCDPAVPVAAAAVLAALARDPLFLRRVAKTDLGRDDERTLAVGELLLARLAAARALSSLEAHGLGHGARAEAFHREQFARAALCALPAGLALRELDPFLGGWAELRGLALAARLRGFLRERHDEDWWRNPRGLAALRGLWLRGGRPGARELWQEVAPAEEPAVDALAAELTAACG